MKGLVPANWKSKYRPIAAGAECPAGSVRGVGL